MFFIQSKNIVIEYGRFDCLPDEMIVSNNIEELEAFITNGSMIKVEYKQLYIPNIIHTTKTWSMYESFSFIMTNDQGQQTSIKLSGANFDDCINYMEDLSLYYNNGSTYDHVELDNMEYDMELITPTIITDMITFDHIKLI